MNPPRRIVVRLYLKSNLDQPTKLEIGKHHTSVWNWGDALSSYKALLAFGMAFTSSW